MLCMSIYILLHACIHTCEELTGPQNLQYYSICHICEGEYIKISKYSTVAICHTFLPSDHSTTRRWVMSRIGQSVFLLWTEWTFALSLTFRAAVCSREEGDPLWFIFPLVFSQAQIGGFTIWLTKVAVKPFYRLWWTQQGQLLLTMTSSCLSSGWWPKLA